MVEKKLICNRCKEIKPVSEFFKANTSNRGYNTRCKQCIKPLATISNKKRYKQRKAEGYYHRLDRIERKKRDLDKKYGITLEEYHTLLSNQNGKCAICLGENKVKYKNEKETFFCVDHCHKTGKIRGLLCVQCNAALGQFKEDLGNLNRAINYIKINMEGD